MAYCIATSAVSGSHLHDERTAAHGTLPGPKFRDSPDAKPPAPERGSLADRSTSSAPGELSPGRAFVRRLDVSDNRSRLPRELPTRSSAASRPSVAVTRRRACLDHRPPEVATTRTFMAIRRNPKCQQPKQ